MISFLFTVLSSILFSSTLLENLSHWFLPEWFFHWKLISRLQTLPRLIHTTTPYLYVGSIPLLVDFSETFPLYRSYKVLVVLSVLLTHPTQSISLSSSNPSFHHSNLSHPGTVNIIPVNIKEICCVIHPPLKLVPCTQTYTTLIWYPSLLTVPLTGQM